jgi:hypothetical protein
VKIDYRDVSGFHAEFAIRQNQYYISDFSSKKGTFVNDEKISGEKQVKAGDFIKIGSALTVFIPHDAVFAKKNSRRGNYLEFVKTGAATYKKGLIVVCVLLLSISAIKMISGKSSDGKELITKKNKIVGAEHSKKEGSETKNGQNDTPAKNVGQNKVNSSAHNRKNVSEISAGNKPNEVKESRQDTIPSVYFKVANKFSEYQLWRDALDHYQKILETNHDYPGLSAQIDKMQFELSNQEKYQGGQLLITNGNYIEGIAKLKNISKKSFYYNKAGQVISDAKEKLAQPSK